MEYKKEWFNDEDFWKIFAPIMFDEKHWAEVPEVADGVTRLAGLMLYTAGRDGKTFPIDARPKGPCTDSGPRVLDLCCGMGRITSELSRRGYAATGVDLSASLLETAREDASYEGLDIEYIQADARSFRRSGFFDSAVNLYISFGYFENPAHDLLVARNVYESLKPGGSFIIETLGKEIAARDFTPGEWFMRAGFTVLTEYEVVDSWAALKNRWILIKSGSPAQMEPGGALRKDSRNSPVSQGTVEIPVRVEKTFIQRLYAAAELRSLFFEAGFSVVEIYGGWDERPYDQNAQALIAVGRKGIESSCKKA